MPNTHTITTYSFDELSDAAKEKARAWWREDGLDYEWWDCIYEDAATIADLMGLDIRQTLKTRGDGTTYYAPTIYFSGFSCQGDGACFEGTYKYQKGSLKAVKEYAPKDEDLHRIAQELQNLQCKHFYALTASTRQCGHHNHSGCMIVEVYDSRDGDPAHYETDETLTELLRDFADWIYARLDAEYDYLNSDESVDESIRINEDEFTEEGKVY